MEAGIAFNTRKVQGDNWNLFHISLFQGTADKADIIGCPASASCLGHNNCGFIQVIFTGKESLHNLPYNQKGRVAGIIIDIFQSHIHGVFIIVIQYNKVIAAGIKGRLQDFKMDRRHLGTDNGIILPHFFCEGYLFNGRRVDGTGTSQFFSYSDGREQGTNPDSGSPKVIDLINF